MPPLKSEEYAGYKIFFDKDPDTNTVWGKVSLDGQWHGAGNPTKAQTYRDVQRLIDRWEKNNPIVFHLIDLKEISHAVTRSDLQGIAFSKAQHLTGITHNERVEDATRRQIHRDIEEALLQYVDGRISRGKAEKMIQMSLDRLKEDTR